MSVIRWRSGVPIEGEQEGEGQPFRGWKGQVFPACEPRKGHFESTEAKGQGCSLMENRICHIINRLQKYSMQKSGNSGLAKVLKLGLQSLADGVRNLQAASQFDLSASAGLGYHKTYPKPFY